MGLYEIVVEHEGTSHHLHFDSDDGLEVLRFQLFSLTLVPPDKQTIMDSSFTPIQSESELLGRLSSRTSVMHTFTLLDATSKSTNAAALAEMEKADEALARLLQAEEEAYYLLQQSGQDGQLEFVSRIEGYISQVLQYEDISRQEKARQMVRLEELEEQAIIALAKEERRNPSSKEIEHYTLFQLLMWFKKSFRWMNAPCCCLCGADANGIGMGKPTREDLQYGANRVELYRCKRCHSITRFPRYNDPLKLIETRSGRCGEWANCFTLYCRAFGYQARLVLDFTDHVWTECFSDFLGRWIHLDPCEGAFDKPLLYEQGWGKKLNYLIALSSDGVYDVTKRYTRRWDEVRLRRTLTSELGVANVAADLTARLRSKFSQEYLNQLKSRDREEAEELDRFLHEQGGSEALPGRLTGTVEWRKVRGELGTMMLPENECLKRPCVDGLVSKVFEALGHLHGACEEGSPVMGILEALLKMLQKLHKAPYKTRQAGFSLQSADVSPVAAALKAGRLQNFLLALALEQKMDGEEEVQLHSLTPVDTAIALPVALESLENLIKNVDNSKGSESVRKRLAFMAEHERLSGVWAQGSGEELPLGIASAAFDGLQSTKWEEPNGSKGGWLTYHLPSTSEVTAYEVMSANDCPERDPKDWVLEGSNDGGAKWTVLDNRESQLFNGRFERKAFEVPPERRCLSNAFRLRFLAVRDSSSQSRLQLSCVDFYRQKQLK